MTKGDNTKKIIIIGGGSVGKTHTLLEVYKNMANERGLPLVSVGETPSDIHNIPLRQRTNIDDIEQLVLKQNSYEEFINKNSRSERRLRSRKLNKFRNKER